MIVSQVIERQWCPFTTVSLKYENLKLQIVRKKPSLLSLSQIKTPYYAFQLQLRHRKTNERKSSKKKHFYHFTLKCPCSVNKVKYRRSACVLSSSIFPQSRPWAFFVLFMWRWVLIEKYQTMCLSLRPLAVAFQYPCL